MVHPITGGAFAGAEETDALDFKLFADESIEIDAGGNDVAAKIGGTAVAELKVRTKFGEDLFGEERDLPLIVFLVAKKTVAADAAAGHALHLIYLKGRVFPGGLAVATKIVVTGRNEEATKVHG